MALDYLDRLLKKIQLSSGMSLSLEGKNERQSFLTRIKGDVSNIAFYINHISFEIFRTLPSGPEYPFDARLDGLDGKTIVLDVKATPWGPECYWVGDGTPTGGRPATIKEVIDCIIANLGTQTVNNIFQKDPELEQRVGDVEECCRCNDIRLKNLASDTISCAYAEALRNDCVDGKKLQYSLGWILWQLFDQEVIHTAAIEGEDGGVEDFTAAISIFADSGACDDPSLVRFFIPPPVIPDPPDFELDLDCVETYIGYLAADPGCLPFTSWAQGPLDMATRTAPFNCVHKDTDNLAKAIARLDSCFGELDHDASDAWTYIFLRNNLDFINPPDDRFTGGGELGKPGLVGDTTLFCDNPRDELTIIAGPGIRLTGWDSGEGPGNPSEYLEIAATDPPDTADTLQETYDFGGADEVLTKGLIELESTYTALFNWMPRVAPALGSGIHITDDAAAIGTSKLALQSKLFAITAPYIGPLGALPGGIPHSPQDGGSYFSVGAHYAGTSLFSDHWDNIAENVGGFTLPDNSYLPVVHLHESVLYMGTQSPSWVPRTTGKGYDLGHPLYDVDDGFGTPSHGLVDRDEGAIWINEDTNPSNKDACGRTLALDHLYYRMPGDGRIWRLSDCGEDSKNNLWQAYVQDNVTWDIGGLTALTPDGQWDGGLIAQSHLANIPSIFLHENKNFKKYILRDTDGDGAVFDEKPIVWAGGQAGDLHNKYWTPQFVVAEDWDDGDDDWDWQQQWFPTNKGIGAEELARLVDVGLDPYTPTFSVQRRSQFPYFYSFNKPGNKITSGALSSGEVSIDGEDVGASSASDSPLSYADAAGSAQAKAVAINAITAQTGFTATAWTGTTFSSAVSAGTVWWTASTAALKMSAWNSATLAEVKGYAVTRVTFSGVPADTSWIKLTDGDGVEATFEMDDAGNGAGSNVALDPSTSDAAGVAAELALEINTHSSLKIAAFASGTTVHMYQEVVGVVGNKTLSFSTSPSFTTATSYYADFAHGADESTGVAVIANDDSGALRTAINASVQSEVATQDADGHLVISYSDGRNFTCQLASVGSGTPIDQLIGDPDSAVPSVTTRPGNITITGVGVPDFREALEDGLGKIGFDPGKDDKADLAHESVHLWRSILYLAYQSIESQEMFFPGTHTGEGCIFINPASDLIKDFEGDNISAGRLVYRQEHDGAYFDLCKVGAGGGGGAVQNIWSILNWSALAGSTGVLDPVVAGLTKSFVANNNADKFQFYALNGIQFHAPGGLAGINANLDAMGIGLTHGFDPADWAQITKDGPQGSTNKPFWIFWNDDDSIFDALLQPLVCAWPQPGGGNYYADLVNDLDLSDNGQAYVRPLYSSAKHIQLVIDGNDAVDLSAGTGFKLGVLADVDFVNAGNAPADGEVLTYNTATETWIPSPCCDEDLPEIVGQVQAMMVSHGSGIDLFELNSPTVDKVNFKALSTVNTPDHGSVVHSISGDSIRADLTPPDAQATTATDGYIKTWSVAAQEWVDGPFGSAATNFSAPVSFSNTITDGSGQIDISEGHPDPTVSATFGYEDTGSSSVFIANKYAASGSDDSTFGIRMKGAAAANEVVTVTGLGNVGIGKVPTEALDVVGTIRLSENHSDATVAGKLHYEDTGSSSMYAANLYDDDLATFGIRMKGEDSSDEVLTVTGSGKVGIGNTSPESHPDEKNDLVIGNATGHHGITIASGIGAISTLRLAYDTTANNGEGWIDYHNTSKRMRFGTDGLTTRGTIDTSGWAIGDLLAEDYTEGKRNLVVGTTSDHTGIAIVSGPTHIGTIQFVSNTTVNDIEGWIDYSQNSKTMRFGTNGLNTRMVIGPTGNIGMGTITPSEKLEVDGNAKVTGTMQVTGGTSATSIAYGSGNNTGWYFPSQHVMRAAINGTQKLSIDATGLGIGTISPSEKLHIDGPAAKLKISDEANFDGEIVAYTASGTPHIHLKSHGVTASGGISFRDNADNQEWAIVTNTVVGDGLEFVDGSNSVVMNLAHGGNIGIGTTSPDTNLDVKATAHGDGIQLEDDGTTTKVIKIKADSAGGVIEGRHIDGTHNFHIDATGNSWVKAGYFGIGTDSPGALLHTVDGAVKFEHSSSNLQVDFESNDSAILKFVNNGVSESTIFRTNRYFKFDTGDAVNNALVINALGKVGIGVASPAHTLDVAGDVNLTGDLSFDASSTTVNAILDEDNLSTDSATALATQQSIKAYVDAQIATEDTLAELNDTDITSPADASLLLYDTGTSTWRDGAMSGDATISDTGAVTLAATNTNLTTLSGVTSLGTLTSLTGGTGDLNWDSGTLFVDSSAGKVGIGISSPDDYVNEKDNLVIGATSGHTGMTIVSGATSIGTIQFRSNTTVNGIEGWIDYSQNSKEMRIGTDGLNTRLTVDSSGAEVEGRVKADAFCSPVVTKTNPSGNVTIGLAEKIVDLVSSNATGIKFILPATTSVDIGSIWYFTSTNAGVSSGDRVFISGDGSNITINGMSATDSANTSNISSIYEGKMVTAICIGVNTWRTAMMGV